MTQISLFDEVPPDVAVPATGKPAVVYGHEDNQRNGHLLISTGPPRTGQDWLFENTGGGVIRCCLPGWDTGVDLTPDQLRILGDYCHRMADRLEAA